MTRQDIKAEMSRLRITQREIVKFINKETGLTCKESEMSMALTGSRPSEKSDKLLLCAEQYINKRKELNKKIADIESKAYLDVDDIRKRYDCGVGKAYTIIRSIKDTCGGALGGCAKVLVSEVERWERMMGGNA